MRKIRPYFAALLLLVAIASPAAFAAQGPGAHALTGARIVIAPGKVVESGTLVLRDGIIEAVGADVAIPADARVWELEGSTLYPGLIEPYHVADWPEPGDGDDAPVPQGGHANVLVHPERDMVLHAVDEGRFKKLREAGFTTAVVVPKPGMFRGSSVLVNLGAGAVHDNLLRRDVAQNAQLAKHPKGEYPNSTMGAVALFRQALYDARWQRQAQKAFTASPRQRRPAFSTALEALDAAAHGEQTIVLESTDPTHSLRLAALAAEFDLEAWIVGNGAEYQRLQDISAAGHPLLLPVKFPEAPKVSGDALAVTLATLRHWQQAPSNPAQLKREGVRFAVTSHGLNDPKKLHEMLVKASDHGFSSDDALASLTTVPTELLGISDSAGTLEAGKMANVVVSEGDLFAGKAKIRAMFIDGRHYEIKESKPPLVDPAGTWEIIIDAGPGGQIPVTVVFTGTLENLSGLIQSPMGSLPLAEIEVSGEVVEFSFDSSPMGMPGSISFSMSIDGETCSGPGSSPQGDFNFTGNRTSKPDAEEP